MKVGGFELQEPLPDLNEPHAIAILRPWVDAGNVGTLALSRLEESLGAQELGRLTTPGEYFDFTRYRPNTHQVEGRRVLSVPNTVISYTRREEGPDFLLCRVMEPHSSAEQYISSLVELFTALNVKRYCRIGAMYDAVPHTRPILVTGTLAGQPIPGPAGIMARTHRNYEGPTTILGLLNDQLEKHGIEQMMLMARLPQYLQIEDDYNGTARMLEALASIYHLPYEFPETDLGQRQYRRVQAEVERNGPAQELIHKLEAEYDSHNAGAAEEESPLSPDVQRFLHDLSGTLDEPQE